MRHFYSADLGTWDSGWNISLRVDNPTPENLMKEALEQLKSLIDDNHLDSESSFVVQIHRSTKISEDQFERTVLYDFFNGFYFDRF